MISCTCRSLDPKTNHNIHQRHRKDTETGTRIDQERGRARLSRSRVSQAEAAGLSVNPGSETVFVLAARWHVRRIHAPRESSIKSEGHENARRHEVTQDAWHDTGLRLARTLSFYTGVLTAATAMRLVDPVVLEPLPSPRDMSNIFTHWEKLPLVVDFVG